jgi:glycosyltransferase involved in cell wall biosynthesis
LYFPIKNPIGTQLERKNKKILVICPHPVGYVPGQRLKFEQYFELWRSNGFDVEVSPFMSEHMQRIVYLEGHLFEKITGTLGGFSRRVKDLFRIRKYDIIYLFLWATPFGPPVSEWIIRKLAHKIVYDIDDLVYKPQTSPHNRFIKFLKSASKVNFLMRHADHVVVSTEKLMEYAKKFTQHISLIPATIDVNKYTITNSNKTNNIVIGWSGSHTTSKYLHLLDHVLKQIADRHPIKIMVMGDKNFAIKGVNIELIEWTADKEIEYLKQFDIGIYPIPDEEWVYGKSGGKLVQYMAAGVPIVASAIGPNFKAIKDGYNGFLVSSEEEWITKLELLIKDEKLRKQMGNNAKSYAIEFYSIEANVDKYLSIFNSL